MKTQDITGRLPIIWNKFWEWRRMTEGFKSYKVRPIGWGARIRRNAT